MRQHTGIGVEVGSIVVLHGGGWSWSDGETHRRVADALVVRGSEHRGWRDLLPARGLQPAAVYVIASALRTFGVTQQRDMRGLRRLLRVTRSR